jgi:hypothetical protein
MVWDAANAPQLLAGAHVQVTPAVSLVVALIAE